MMRNSRQGKNTSKGINTCLGGVVSSTDFEPLNVTKAERIRQGGLIDQAEDVCRCLHLVELVDNQGRPCMGRAWTFPWTYCLFKFLKHGLGWSDLYFIRLCWTIAWGLTRSAQEWNQGALHEGHCTNPGQKGKGSFNLAGYAHWYDVAGKGERDVKGDFQVLTWCLGKDEWIEEFRRRNWFGSRLCMYEGSPRAI